MQVAETKALACQLPAETGIPLSRWSCPELAAEQTAILDLILSAERTPVPGGHLVLPFGIVDHGLPRVPD
ncbi:hypothetical protein [Nonomuraea aurantiaca]|uniref:hypothetical protein n=1 Tax=Nonomuraea aurantiaca TaxID=2878562 RepID=UPI001CDA12F3|nr:hypothetical protein [Nonomuraea aurantiaca]MCA2226076.1 hypothetical protein [Nonomuraea aurantiaca]